MSKIPGISADPPAVDGHDAAGDCRVPVLPKAIHQGHRHHGHEIVGADSISALAPCDETIQMGYDFSHRGTEDYRDHRGIFYFSHRDIKNLIAHCALRITH